MLLLGLGAIGIARAETDTWVGGGVGVVAGISEAGVAQGVRRIENVNVYTERGARNLAAQYDRAVAAPYPSLLAR